MDVVPAVVGDVDASAGLGLEVARAGRRGDVVDGVGGGYGAIGQGEGPAEVHGGRDADVEELRDGAEVLGRWVGWAVLEEADVDGGGFRVGVEEPLLRQWGSWIDFVVSWGAEDCTVAAHLVDGLWSTDRNGAASRLGGEVADVVPGACCLALEEAWAIGAFDLIDRLAVAAGFTGGTERSGQCAICDEGECEASVVCVHERDVCGRRGLSWGRHKVFHGGGRVLAEQLCNRLDW